MASDSGLVVRQHETLEPCDVKFILEVSKNNNLDVIMLPEIKNNVIYRGYIFSVYAGGEAKEEKEVKTYRGLLAAVPHHISIDGKVIAVQHVNDIIMKNEHVTKEIVSSLLESVVVASKHSHIESGYFYNSAAITPTHFKTTFWCRPISSIQAFQAGYSTLIGYGGSAEHSEKKLLLMESMVKIYEDWPDVSNLALSETKHGDFKSLSWTNRPIHAALSEDDWKYLSRLNWITFRQDDVIVGIACYTDLKLFIQHTRKTTTSARLVFFEPIQDSYTRVIATHLFKHLKDKKYTALHGVMIGSIYKHHSDLKIIPTAETYLNFFNISSSSRITLENISLLMF